MRIRRSTIQIWLAKTDGNESVNIVAGNAEAALAKARLHFGKDDDDTVIITLAQIAAADIE
jgi:hypothetical protein